MSISEQQLLSLENFIEGKSKIELPGVSVERGTEKISGSGDLSLTQDKKLLLRLINDQWPIDNEELKSFNERFNKSYIQEGKLIPNDSYFLMTGIDCQGYNYSCENIYQPFMFVQKESEFSIESDLIIRTKSFSEPCRKAIIVLKDNYKFAVNPIDGIINSASKAEPAWHLQANELSITIAQKKNNIQLDVISNSMSLDEAIINNILYSFDFVMGRVHTPIYFIFEGESDNFEIRIKYNRSFPDSKRMFEPPYGILLKNGDEVKINSRLFESYFIYLEKYKDQIISKLQKRVAEASKGYQFIFGLVLSTAIESITVNYFQAYFIPKDDPLFKVDILNLEIELDEICKHEDFKKTIRGMLTKLKSGDTSTPKKILNALEEKIIISKGLANNWNKLRNKFAHGTDTNNDISKGIELINKNVVLFYQLIFNLIGYSGKYVNYSINGNKVENYPSVCEKCKE